MSAKGSIQVGLLGESGSGPLRRTMGGWDGFLLLIPQQKLSA